MAKKAISKTNVSIEENEENISINGGVAENNGSCQRRIIAKYQC
jgi:hypothetical protein